MTSSTRRRTARAAINVIFGAQEHAKSRGGHYDGFLKVVDVRRTVGDASLLSQQRYRELDGELLKACMHPRNC